MEAEEVSARRFARQSVCERVEIVRIEARAAFVVCAPFNAEVGRLSDSADRATGEEAEGCGAPRHAREVAHEHLFDLLPALRVGFVRPEVQAFDDVGRGDVDGIAHFRACDD